VKEKRKRGFAWFVMALFLTELGIVFLVIPHAWVSRVGSYDRGFVYQWFGGDFEARVLRDAMSWFNALFVNTGIQDATYNFLIGQWDNSQGVQIDDRGLGALTKDRLSTMWAAVSVAMYRFSEMAKWCALLLPLLFAVVVDGLTQREINKWRYFSPSPVVQHASTMTILMVSALGLLLPFAPVPLYAPLIPVLMVLALMTAWMALANMAKRL